jgi:transposase
MGALGRAPERRRRARRQTESFVAFRSHWGFDSEFCNAGRGNEKGGVESEVGYLPPEPLDTGARVC